jgi:hypothetical protein
LAEAQGGLARSREPMLQTHGPETKQVAAMAEDIRRASERLAEARHPGRDVEPPLAVATAEVQAALQLHGGVWTGEAIR